MTLQAHHDAPAARPRRRWRTIWLILAATLVVLAFAAVKHGFIDNEPKDVLFATISWLDGDYTIYSDGYRESAFRSLRISMTAKEVEAILGPPLDVGKWQETEPGQPITTGQGQLHDRWNYTRGNKPLGNYWRREVWFKAGAVDRIEGGFYLD